jgi:Tfp pilus assembly protein FimT
MRYYFGLTILELMVSLALIGLLFCFTLPLYQTQRAFTETKLFQKELTSILTTARLEAFLLQKPLKLEPIHLGLSNEWEQGIRLSTNQDTVLHRWTWSYINRPVLWFGFRSKQSITIDFLPEKLAMNGYFQIGDTRLIVNRFGRVRCL